MSISQCSKPFMRIPLPLNYNSEHQRKVKIKQLKIIRFGLLHFPKITPHNSQPKKDPNFLYYFFGFFFFGGCGHGRGEPIGKDAALARRWQMKRNEIELSA